MPYHIKRPNQLMPSIDVYYVGENRWSDNYSDRKIFSAKTKANAAIKNPDGKNGGFKNATVITE